MDISYRCTLNHDHIVMIAAGLDQTGTVCGIDGCKGILVEQNEDGTYAF